MFRLRAAAALVAALAGIGLFTHVAPAEGQPPSQDRTAQVSRTTEASQVGPAVSSRTVGVQGALRSGRVASISAR